MDTDHTQDCRRCGCPLEEEYTSPALQFCGPCYRHEERAYAFRCGWVGGFVSGAIAAVTAVGVAVRLTTNP